MSRAFAKTYFSKGFTEFLTATYVTRHSGARPAPLSQTTSSFSRITVARSLFRFYGLFLGTNIVLACYLYLCVDGYNAPPKTLRSGKELPANSMYGWIVRLCPLYCDLSLRRPESPRCSKRLPNKRVGKAAERLYNRLNGSSSKSYRY